ncbi:endonuclease/exonuclease/phosphatase family protein [Formicincola oecophyllae]|uniref:Endonuclease/exonuclease/phosphatase family protein n=1 Tax=Formicincola oecophyllae TaxID=2558361 RepID=A0A4Y6U9A7_9PROT|nr:endonuclease/exonuclease/phosphatase family protein [Formicincola oecophyllae]QDH13962.1 endonuclease/exonuclease/phosphatase family protein [Formicincola oecophyllae]
MTISPPTSATTPTGAAPERPTPSAQVGAFPPAQPGTPHSSIVPQGQGGLANPPWLRVVSWNLLHIKGATLHDVLRLVDLTNPDVLLMQEALPMTDALPGLLGGHYARACLPGRPHGTACWSRLPFDALPALHPLPPGMIVRRNAQVMRFQAPFGPFCIANVHLSHGQILNRRQLRHLRAGLLERAIIMGDFNQVGPALLGEFKDVGPRARTHLMLKRIPLRLDRCLVRGFQALERGTLPTFGSDHKPISLLLQPSPV